MSDQGYEGMSEQVADVERALAAADAGNAGHWPMVAAVLADEVRRLRGTSSGGTTDPFYACDTESGVHEWTPVSFVFESQLLDREGRVLIRQPDIKNGRVYLVCKGCWQHTYATSKWIGYYIPGIHDPEHLSNRPDDEAGEDAA